MKSPVPKTPDNFAYWLISAIVAATVGAFVYQYLKDTDPLPP